MKNLPAGYNIKKAHFLFLLKILVFFFVFFILDFIIGSLLSYYYFKQDSGTLFNTTYAIEDTKADILIFGTSKANHSYNTETLTERLNLSAYNTGRDGSSIFYDYAILKAVLKRYSPKIIILDVTWEFDT